MIICFNCFHYSYNEDDWDECEGCGAPGWVTVTAENLEDICFHLPTGKAHALRVSFRQLETWKENPIAWRGKKLLNQGDVMDAVGKISSREEARAFLSTYEKLTPYARENIVNFASKYFGTIRTPQILELFKEE